MIGNQRNTKWLIFFFNYVQTLKQHILFAKKQLFYIIPLILMTIWIFFFNLFLIFQIKILVPYYIVSSLAKFDSMHMQVTQFHKTCIVRNWHRTKWSNWNARVIYWLKYNGRIKWEIFFKYKGKKVPNEQTIIIRCYVTTSCQS